MEKKMKKIIKFEKPNCQPCEMVSVLLNEAGIKYDAVNPFDQPELAMKHKVRSVPTVVVLENEQEVDRIMGVDAERLAQLAL